MIFRCSKWQQEAAGTAGPGPHDWRRAYASVWEQSGGRVTLSRGVISPPERWLPMGEVCRCCAWSSMPTFLFNRQIRYVRYGGCKRLTDLTGLTADFRKAKLSGHSSATAFFLGHGTSHPSGWSWGKRCRDSEIVDSSLRKTHKLKHSRQENPWISLVYWWFGAIPMAGWATVVFLEHQPYIDVITKPGLTALVVISRKPTFK